MKRSLRLLFATVVMAATITAAATAGSTNQLGTGAEPVPLCPPGTPGLGSVGKY